MTHIPDNLPLKTAMLHYMHAQLVRNRGQRTITAKELDVSIRYLRAAVEKMRELGLDVPSVRNGRPTRDA